MVPSSKSDPFCARNQCPKKFVYAYQLRSHEQTAHAVDTAEKPVIEKHAFVIEGDTVDPGEADAENGVIHTVYQCSLCHMVFPTYPDLQDHCSSHSLEQLANQAVADSGATTTTTQVLSVGNEQILLEVTNDVSGADGHRGPIDGLDSVMGANGPAQDYYVLYESGSGPSVSEK